MDVMVDIETFSTQSNACVLTIGAIKFSRKNNLESFDNCDKFYKRISKESCDILGLHTDSNTLDWWNKQSEDAKYEVFTNQDRVSLKEALIDFTVWFGNSRYIWSHGSVFDITILNNAYNACNLIPPWKFWNVRDTRTIYDIGKVYIKNIQNDNHHHALYDCYNQIIGIKKGFLNLKLNN